MSDVQILVVAKAPIAGRVKTRLGKDIGMEAAARIAAGALRDTLTVCVQAYGADRCHLALAGDLAEAVDGPALLELVKDWSVFGQHGDGFAERLVNAHLDVAARAKGPVVQIGMDTPQVTSSLLAGVVDALESQDAVLGPADDGGWWVLALIDPRAVTALAQAEMSTPTTCRDTRRAFERAGLSIGTTAALRDIDTLADADAVAALVPGGHFAAAWSPTRRHTTPR